MKIDIKKVLRALASIVIAILPRLMSAAEKSFKKLPKEQQETLKTISKLIEVIKLTSGMKYKDVTDKITAYTGLSEDEAGQYLIAYLKERGTTVRTLTEAIYIINQEIEKRGETGTKGLFQEMMSIMGNVIAGIDWKILALGIGEVVFRNFVKGKIF